MEQIAAILFFAIPSAFSPGPNNLMLVSSGMTFGIRRTLPLMLGIVIGFVIMLGLVGLGIGQVFEQIPELHFYLKVIGTAYLLYLAWLIARSSGIDEVQASKQPMNFIQGALFQWVNPREVLHKSVMLRASAVVL